MTLSCAFWRRSECVWTKVGVRFGERPSALWRTLRRVSMALRVRFGKRRKISLSAIPGTMPVVEPDVPIGLFRAEMQAPDEDIGLRRLVCFSTTRDRAV